MKVARSVRVAPLPVAVAFSSPSSLGRSLRAGGRLMLALACLAVLPTIANAQAPATPAADPNTPDVILAERFADLASESLQGSALTTAMYRQSGLLLEAASRINPAEARFHRLRYEAMLQAGDIAAALDALVASARLDTNDLGAQAKIIELYVQRMETAEDKLKYLRQDILGTATIPGEIRSHAAVLASRVLLERGERKLATQLADEATRLNPLNAEAQHLRYDLLLSTASDIDRLTSLLAIVRASPLDARAITTLAEELSKAGLDESNEWYEAALGLSLRNGTTPDRGMLLNYASRLLTSGNIPLAQGLSDKILQADPDDSGAHFIRLSIDRLQGDPAVVAAHKAAARTSFTNGLIEIAKVAGDPTASTRPSNTTESFAPPLPESIAERVKLRGTLETRQAFVIASSDLAWLYLYYLEEDPNRIERAEQLITGMKVLLPADSALIARLEGWLFLVKKKDAEARVKLSAVEDTDALASLGLLKLETDSMVAGARARKLRSQFSHGVMGAIVASENLVRKTPLVLTTSSEAIREKLSSFPKKILRLIDSPQDFYFIRAEPVVSNVDYGAPMFVKVTLVNSSEFDLPLGPQGAIRNDLWFDAQVRGLKPASFPATAFDRLSGPLVLHPRQSATRVVRIDQAKLRTFLRFSPFASVVVGGTVMTNPAILGGNFAPGAGGYQVQFTRLIEQANVPVATADQQKALLTGLSTAPSRKRPALIDAAVMNYQLLKGNEAAVPPEGIARLRTAIDALVSDPDVTARGWGTLWALLISEGDTRLAKAKVATTDSSWVVRILALCGSRGPDIASYRAIATMLKDDNDPLVAHFAQAVIEELNDRVEFGSSTAKPAK